MDLTLNEALIGLFTSAFVSATLFPGGSEAVLLALIHHWPEELVLALSVATVGNTLGSMTSYVIGRLFPKKVSGRAIEWFERWGVWALLFAWLPVVGDALPVAAGWLRIGWVKSLIFILIGKALRYCALALGFSQLF